jgi:hypothetical protein
MLRTATKCYVVGISTGTDQIQCGTGISKVSDYRAGGAVRGAIVVFLFIRVVLLRVLIEPVPGHGPTPDSN